MTTLGGLPSVHAFTGATFAYGGILTGISVVHAAFVQNVITAAQRARLFPIASCSITLLYLVAVLGLADSPQPSKYWFVLLPSIYNGVAGALECASTECDALLRTQGSIRYAAAVACVIVSSTNTGDLMAGVAMISSVLYCIIHFAAYRRFGRWHLAGCAVSLATVGVTLMTEEGAHFVWRVVPIVAAVSVVVRYFI